MSLQDQRGDPLAASRCGRAHFTLAQLPHHLHRPVLVLAATSTRSSTWRINTVLSVLVALPAAYAFSRYRFLGDKHLFFWLLTNRMTPPAVFLLPFFQLYSTVGLMDTHLAVALAHLLFNVPLAVWILEGFMSGVPREIDETAYIDGYCFPRFFVTHLPAADQGRRRRDGVLLLHVQLGRAAAGAHAHLGQRQADRRHHDAHRVAPPAWTGACWPRPACSPSCRARW